MAKMQINNNLKLLEYGIKNQTKKINDIALSISRRDRSLHPETRIQVEEYKETVNELQRAIDNLLLVREPNNEDFN